MMADIDSLHIKEHVFGDVGRMICNPLQIADHRHQTDSVLYISGRLFHKTDQFMKRRVAEVIDGIIGS